MVTHLLLLCMSDSPIPVWTQQFSILFYLPSFISHFPSFKLPFVSRDLILLNPVALASVLACALHLPRSPSKLGKQALGTGEKTTVWTRHLLPGVLDVPRAPRHRLRSEQRVAAWVVPPWPPFCPHRITRTQLLSRHQPNVYWSLAEVWCKRWIKSPRVPLRAPNCTVRLLVSKANGSEGARRMKSTFCRPTGWRTTTWRPCRASGTQEDVLLVSKMIRNKTLV